MFVAPGDHGGTFFLSCQPVWANEVVGQELISTSFVERQNLTMRMGMRRFTRLTNAFSKKVENLAHAVALHFMPYNFCRPHQSLGTNNTSNGVRTHRSRLDGGRSRRAARPDASLTVIVPSVSKLPRCG